MHNTARYNHKKLLTIIHYNTESFYTYLYSDLLHIIQSQSVEHVSRMFDVGSAHKSVVVNMPNELRQIDC